ncbi:AAA family ATPase [Hugenholtzia roseola]|uniref:AAA family ATPase n=1 Tax=Hugenholtzia roseola TaxID=1002 RepID=UPI0003FC5737|nr:ATP-binding protein [Hugenholtzia roseola]
MPYSSTQGVVLFGAESTGKSTLSVLLANHYQTLYNPEFVRSYLEERHLFGLIQHQKQISYTDVEMIALGQLISEKNCFRQASLLEKKYVFFDTNLITTLVYSREIYKQIPVFLEAMIEKQPYDHYFLLDTEGQWQPDLQRESPAVQHFFQEKMRAELEKRNLVYELISGSELERLQKIIQFLDKN